MFRTFISAGANRIIFALICLLIILTGLSALTTGHLDYLNWRGIIVFAPFAIIVGSLGLTVAAFKPQFFQSTKKTGRVRGRK
jgi:hypothetical protein